MRGRAGASVVPIRLASDRTFEAGDFLGRVCRGDPLVGAVVPVAARRTRQDLATAGRSLIRYGERWGEVYSTDGLLEGLAIWLPPAPKPVRIARAGAAFLAAFSTGLAVDDAWRLLALGFRLARARRAAIARPHWHLVALLVDPRHPEEVGEALIAPILARADAEGLPCYVASARAQEVLFFVRHGFVVAGESDLPGRGNHLWSLVREPVSASR